MNSDAENIPPERGLLPIRKLSSLIPLRKAARYQFSDPRDGSAFPALKTSTNTFQSSIPIKVLEKRVEPTADGRKDKPSTKSKMATKPTYAKLPASINMHTTPRLPMSPPPEEELREQEKSLRKKSVSQANRSFPSSTQCSSGRKRPRSIVRADSPNPKARKQPKLQRHDGNGQDWEQYAVPLKSSHDVDNEKSKRPHSSASVNRTSLTTKQPEGSNRKESTASRRRSSPRSRSRISVTHSRPATPASKRPANPVIIRTIPPPDMDSLPPPAPPSPSDDPLWLPPPPSRRRPDNSIIYSRRRSNYANDSDRAVSPTPAPRARVSAAAPKPVLVDEEVSMMDSAPEWDDMPSGTDFVVPLNFDSSRSATALMPSFFKSPRKATPVRVRPGSPWLRSPSTAGREDAQENNVDDNGGGWEFAPLQDALSDDSDNEADQPQEIIARRVDILPAEYYSAIYDDQGPEEVNNEEHHSPPATDIEEALRGRSSKPSPLSHSRIVQERSNAVTPARTASPVSTSGFSGGKLLTQRFAELGNKLAAEGRSFRFSEIGALPSSPAIVENYNRHELKFPDLPSSSPDKLAANKEDLEQAVDRSRVENEQLSSDVTEEEEQDEGRGLPRQEVPAESGFNEYSSQEDIEQATSMDKSDYSVRQHHDDYQHEALYQESTEIATAAVTNTLWQSGESVHDAGVIMEAKVLEQLEWQNSQDMASPVRSPAVSVRQNEEQEQEDVSFISPIPARDSPRMEESLSVTSDDSDEEDDMGEREIVAESTYEQEVQSHNLSSSVEDQRNIPQEPSSHRPMLVDPTETAEDHVEYGETIEEEMAHGPSWEDETDTEPLVQIRSNDPMAAARAAAILNLHHEYIQGTPKRQDTSSVWAGSSRRRSMSVMRTPMEITEPRSSQIFATPSRRGGDTSQLAPSPMIHPSVVHPSAEPEWRRMEVTAPPVLLEWTKREWRCLEQCFTDVRMESGQSLDFDNIDPEEVDLDDVVARFVQSYGIGVKLDGEWKWEKMRRRAFALTGRQREGNARGLVSAMTSPTPSVFTPARPTTSVHGPLIRTLQPAPDPLGSTSTLHAPRYTHLTQERGVSPSVKNGPTGHSQSQTGRSTSRDMPPPPYLPARSNSNNPKPVRSQGLYPPLPLPSRPYQIPPSTPLGPTIKPVPEPTSASRKMWNWMGSFLKVGSEPLVSENGEPRELIPSLPLISDADREALRHVSPQPPKPKERIVPPKDQVQLQHVPTPIPIRIPRPLNHKGSSGSVKDMIKGFESISDTDSIRKNMTATRPFVVKKASTGSLSARSMDSSSEWSREQSQSQSASQDISVGSVRSVRDMVQNYSPTTSSQSHAAGRVHVGSFRMRDGTRW